MTEPRNIKVAKVQVDLDLAPLEASYSRLEQLLGELSGKVDSAVAGLSSVGGAVAGVLDEVSAAVTGVNRSVQNVNFDPIVTKAKAAFGDVIKEAELAGEKVTQAIASGARKKPNRYANRDQQVVQNQADAILQLGQALDKVDAGRLERTFVDLEQVSGSATQSIVVDLQIINGAINSLNGAFEPFIRDVHSTRLYLFELKEVAELTTGALAGMFGRTISGNVNVKAFQDIQQAVSHMAAAGRDADRINPESLQKLEQFAERLKIASERMADASATLTVGFTNAQNINKAFTEVVDGVRKINVSPADIQNIQALEQLLKVLNQLETDTKRVTIPKDLAKRIGITALTSLIEAVNALPNLNMGLINQFVPLGRELAAFYGELKVLPILGTSRLAKIEAQFKALEKTFNSINGAAAHTGTAAANLSKINGAMGQMTQTLVNIRNSLSSTLGPGVKSINIPRVNFPKYEQKTIDDFLIFMNTLRLFSSRLASLTGTSANAQKVLQDLATALKTYNTSTKGLTARRAAALGALGHEIEKFSQSLVNAAASGQLPQAASQIEQALAKVGTAIQNYNLSAKGVKNNALGQIQQQIQGVTRTAQGGSATLNNRSRGARNKANAPADDSGFLGSGIGEVNDILPIRGPIVQLTGLLFLLQGAWFGLERAMERVKDVVLGENIALEQHMVSLTQLLGTTQKAKEAITQFAIPFAANVPFFDFDQVVSAMERLAAEGFPIQEITGRLEAGFNQFTGEFEDQFEGSLVKLLASAAVAFGKSLDQSVDAFISAVQGRFVKIRRFGIDTSTLAQFGFDGNRSDKLGIQATLKDIYQVRFGDLIKDQSRTFQGAVSNVQDLLNNIRRQAFEGTFKVVTNELVALVEGLSQFEAAFRLSLTSEEEFKEGLTELMPVPKQLAINLRAISGALAEVTKGFIEALKFVAQFQIQIAAIALVPIITTISRAFGFLFQQLTKSVLNFADLFDKATGKIGIPNLLKQADQIRQIFLDTATPVKKVAEGVSVGPAIASGATAIGDTKQLSLIKQLGIAIMDVFRGLNMTIQGLARFSTAFRFVGLDVLRSQRAFTKIANLIRSVANYQLFSAQFQIGNQFIRLNQMLSQTNPLLNKTWKIMEAGIDRTRGGLKFVADMVEKVAGLRAGPFSNAKLQAPRIMRPDAQILNLGGGLGKTSVQIDQAANAIKAALATISEAFQVTFKNSKGLEVTTSLFRGILAILSDTKLRSITAVVEGLSSAFKGLTQTIGAAAKALGIIAKAGFAVVSFVTSALAGAFKILLLPAIIEALFALQDLSKGIETVRTRALKSLFDTLNRLGETVAFVFKRIAASFGLTLGDEGAGALKAMEFLLEIVIAAFEKLGEAAPLIASAINLLTDALALTIGVIGNVIEYFNFGSDAAVKFAQEVKLVAQELGNLDKDLQKANPLRRLQGAYFDKFFGVSSLGDLNDLAEAKDPEERNAIANRIFKDVVPDGFGGDELTGSPVKKEIQDSFGKALQDAYNGAFEVVRAGKTQKITFNELISIGTDQEIAQQLGATMFSALGKVRAELEARKGDLAPGEFEVFSADLDAAKARITEYVKELGRTTPVANTVSVAMASLTNETTKFTEKARKAVERLQDQFADFDQKVKAARNAFFEASVNGKSEEGLKQFQRGIENATIEGLFARTTAIKELAKLRGESDRLVQNAQEIRNGAQQEADELLKASVQNVRAFLTQSNVSATALSDSQIQQAIQASGDPTRSSDFGAITEQIQAMSGSRSQGNQRILEAAAMVTKYSNEWQKAQLNIKAASDVLSEVRKTSNDVEGRLIEAQGYIQNTVENSLTNTERLVKLGKIDRQTAFERINAARLLLETNSVLRSDTELYERTVTEAMEAAKAFLATISRDADRARSLNMIGDIGELQAATRQLQLVQHTISLLPKEAANMDDFVGKLNDSYKAVLETANRLADSNIKDSKTLDDYAAKIRQSQRDYAVFNQVVSQGALPLLTTNQLLNNSLEALQMRQKILLDTQKATQQREKTMFSAEEASREVTAIDRRYQTEIDGLKALSESMGNERINSEKIAELEEARAQEIIPAILEFQSKITEEGNAQIDIANEYNDLKVKELELLKKQDELARKMASDRKKDLETFTSLQENIFKIQTGKDEIPKDLEKKFALAKLQAGIEQINATQGDRNLRERMELTNDLSKEVLDAQQKGLLTPEELQYYLNILRNLSKQFTQNRLAFNERSEFVKTQQELEAVRSALINLSTEFTTVGQHIDQLQKSVLSYAEVLKIEYAKLQEILKNKAANPNQIFQEAAAAARRDPQLIQAQDPKDVKGLLQQSLQTPEGPVNRGNVQFQSSLDQARPGQNKPSATTSSNPGLQTQLNRANDGLNRLATSADRAQSNLNGLSASVSTTTTKVTAAVDKALKPKPTAAPGAKIGVIKGQSLTPVRDEKFRNVNTGITEQGRLDQEADRLLRVLDRSQTKHQNLDRDRLENEFYFDKTDINHDKALLDLGKMFEESLKSLDQLRLESSLDAAERSAVALRSDSVTQRLSDTDNQSVALRDGFNRLAESIKNSQGNTTSQPEQNISMELVLNASTALDGTIEGVIMKKVWEAFEIVTRQTNASEIRNPQG